MDGQTRPDRQIASSPARGRARLDEQTCRRILDLASKQPDRGQDSLARQLRAVGVSVSASGVRQVLERHGLQTRSRRLAWIEAARTPDPGPILAAAHPEDARVRVDDHGAESIPSARGARTPDNGATRGAHILAVAARLIRERGFDAVSLRDIAEAAGVPPGSMYYHFPTKELLFTSVYKEGIQRLRASVETAYARSRDPWNRLEHACAAHLANLCGGDDFTAISIPTRIPVLSPAANQAVVALNDEYELIFRELVEALNLRAGVSRSLLRLQLLGALNWTSVWYREGGADTAKIARHLVKLLRAGAQAEPRAGSATRPPVAM